MVQNIEKIIKEVITMKKEYKAPIVNMIGVKFEKDMMAGSNDHQYIDAKKSGRIYDDEDAAPAAPKKFWDDEE